MPKSCSVIGCNAKPVNDETIHFFRFPIRDDEKLEKWLEAINREDWVPTANSRICSKHFSKEDICYKGFSKKSCLKQTAMPTLKDVNKQCTPNKQDYKKLYFSAINLISVKEQVNADSEVQEVDNVANEKNNRNSNTIKNCDKMPKSKEHKEIMRRTVLKKILPAPCKNVKREEVKKLIKEQSLAIKAKNMSRKIERQQLKIDLMKDLLAEIMKKNNKVMKNVTAHMKKKGSVDTELLILLQNHLSSIQRLETDMRIKADNIEEKS